MWLALYRSGLQAAEKLCAARVPALIGLQLVLRFVPYRVVLVHPSGAGFLVGLGHGFGQPCERFQGKPSWALYGGKFSGNSGGGRTKVGD